MALKKYLRYLESVVLFALGQSSGTWQPSCPLYKLDHVTTFVCCYPRHFRFPCTVWDRKLSQNTRKTHQGSMIWSFPCQYSVNELSSVTSVLSYNVILLVTFRTIHFRWFTSYDLHVFNTWFHAHSIYV